MLVPNRDLSVEECEAWMREQGILVGKKPDWKRLLREARVGTDQYNLKRRWRLGEAPEDRAKVVAKLLEMETKRKERTPTGARLLGLQEWMQIGEALVHEPALFEAELLRLQQIAIAVRRKHEAQIAIDAADREIYNAVASAITTITAEPKRPRK